MRTHDFEVALYHALEFGVQMHALLITTDDRVVSEFKTIAAVTQTHF